MLTSVVVVDGPGLPGWQCSHQDAMNGGSGADVRSTSPGVASLANLGNTCFLNSVLYTLRYILPSDWLIYWGAYLCKYWFLIGWYFQVHSWLLSQSSSSSSGPHWAGSQDREGLWSGVSPGRDSDSSSSVPEALQHWLWAWRQWPQRSCPTLSSATLYWQTVSTVRG